MQKKVLIIDDSALIRSVLSDIIKKDKQLTVADVAVDGSQALDFLLKGKRYDIILADIQMPKMDGVTFLREMNKHRIRMPVLIVSSIASKNASETIEALELGAFDFVRKPSGGIVGDAYNEFHDEIMVRIYQACRLGEYPEELKMRTPKEPEPVFRAGSNTKPVRKKLGLGLGKKKDTSISQISKLAVIASSTGGPKALQSVIPKFPVYFPYPLVVVQHMPAVFTKSLAGRLDEMSGLHVKEAEDGEMLQNGVVYIAAGGKQCELIQDSSGRYRLSETDKPARGGLRPCADIFLESLEKVQVQDIVCGILTGMGSDGTKGIHMAGIVDEVVPLDQVARTMVKKLGV